MKTRTANLQKPGENRDGSSRNMPISASRLSSQCSLDAASSNSPKTSASLLQPLKSSFQSDCKTARFKQSSLDHSSTVFDASNRPKSTESKRLHGKADALSSASSLNKRAISTERLRASRTEMKLASKSCKSSLTSRRAWQSPNGMFSSLQADSAFSLLNGQISCDLILRPAAAVANRLGSSVQARLISETKSTPSRKDTSIHWPSTDQAENARPSDSLLHARAVCKRWPNAFKATTTRPAMSRSMNLSSEELESAEASALLIQNHKAHGWQKDPAAATSRSVGRSSSEVAPTSMRKPSRWRSPDTKGSCIQEHTFLPHKLQKDFLRNEAQLASSISPTRKFSKANILSSNDPKIVTSGRSTTAASSESISLLLQDPTRRTFQTRNQQKGEKPSIDTEMRERNSPLPSRVADSDTKSSSNQKERPPTASLAISPCHSQPPSPTASQRLLSMSSHEKCGTPASPSRSGFSPARTRLPALSLTTSSPRRLGSINNATENANVRRFTLNPHDEAYMLRLLHNRLLQWHFVNARAEAAVTMQKAVAEKKLFNVGAKTLDLQMAVAMQHMKLQKAKQLQKLHMLLLAHEGQLEGWETIQQEHLAVLEVFTKALEAATLKIPSTGNARADVRAIREAFAIVLDAMHSMESPVRSLSPKLEKVNVLLGEMAKVLEIEMALIYDAKSLVSEIASLQREEHSLKAHIMQTSLGKEKPES